ncbi:hypothetical protein KY315_02475 [Candidatus Woesearchaeota archaeon]|nr:hypothetical protein [Candidatus Woesearchaeota archaeon]
MDEEEQYDDEGAVIDDMELEDIQKDPKEVPANELDFNYQLIEPTWQNLSPHLRKKLVKRKGDKIIISIDEKGNQHRTKMEIYEELAGILALYTKDIRLGNLSTMNGEYDYVVYYLELAPRLLMKGYVRSCITSLNKALSHLETSNSKSAKLRELMQTIIHKTSGSEEPEKKSPFKNAR